MKRNPGGPANESRKPRATKATDKPKRRNEYARETVIPWDRLHAEALSHFGIQHFRPGQRDVLEAIFLRRNVLALMPTGAGKSLCYQLPALFLPKPVLVISPLIALMQDQQVKAEEAEIAVEKLDSTLTASEKSEVEETIQAGIPKLLYVTPERLENTEFLDSIANTGVSLLAVDEAHCISQWGYDFRPAYLSIRYARERLGNPPVLALTATATESVIKDVLGHLDAADAVVVSTGIERNNLQFIVQNTVNTEAKQLRLVELIAQEPGTGIVYTASVRSATEVFEFLQGRGISAALYHGRLRSKERAALYTRFMAGDYKVLVATKAFGLGVDKSDIRFVYHYEFPDSLESYYQEAGRAGRDGEPARAVLLFRLEDRRIQSFFLIGRYATVAECRNLFQSVGEPATATAIAQQAGVPRRRTAVILHLLREADIIGRTRRGFVARKKVEDDTEFERLMAGYEQRRRTDKQHIEEMMHYAESARCRKQLLRAHFGEPEGEPCGACDNCTSPPSALPPIASTRETYVEIASAVGPIRTTAPETLPIPETFGTARYENSKPLKKTPGSV